MVEIVGNNLVINDLEREDHFDANGNFTVIVPKRNLFKKVARVPNKIYLDIETGELKRDHYMPAPVK